MSVLGLHAKQAVKQAYQAPERIDTQTKKPHETREHVSTQARRTRENARMK